MDTLKKYLPYILLLIVGFFAWDSYHNPKVIKVPAIVGNIQPAPITYLEPKGETFNVLWRDKVIERQNPVNDSLFKAYKDLEQKYKDTELELERTKMYLDAITIRDFESTFEDKYLKVNLKGTVQGYLKNVEIERYEIKEREIQKKGLGIDISIYAGYGLGTNFQLTPQIGIGVSKPVIRL